MRKKKCDVSILVVSYNTKDFTLACLESIYRETRDHTFEVIVLDNASDDGSADAVAQLYPNAHIIACNENLGFAVGNNRAADFANGKYILLLNPDTVVLNGAIDRICSFADKNPTFRLYGGRTLYSDGKLNESSCWGSMTLWSVFCNASGLRKMFPASSVFNSEGIGNWRRDTVREVGMVTGCFLLVTHDLWKELGGFSQHYFMYAEEADLCLRARALGARPIIYPDATIIHHGSASDPVAWEKQIKVLQGKVTLMYDHWSPLTRALGVALLTYRALNHCLAYRLIALVTRRERFRERANTFAQILKHRRTWQRGYRTEVPFG